MAKRQLFLMSTSKVFGHGILEHPKPYILDFFKKNNVKKIIFVPYADVDKDYDGYTKKFADVFAEWGYETEGIHKFANPVDAVNSAQCVYIGGGNTFVLLKTLYDLNLIEAIRKRVLEDGMPYMGSSAGSNVATVNIKTTNDMPIIYPSTFDGMNLVPFNINPHYLDANPDDPHQGETREDRIKEFHAINDGPVLGLREGTYAAVDGNQAILRGTFNARLFTKNNEPRELTPDTDISFLL